MTHAELSPAEITFGFDELFFSRTDLAGIILFGNSVFQRVAIYSWDELLGKPHKIVRHPDMPRAVFYALWDTIKQGQPIGAYVKNRAKDGRFYWVFAIVTPIEGGYLSVRLRPSSEIFGVVKTEYEKLAALEAREHLKPADSAALLLGRLTELGFADYRTFMATALGHELAARDAKLGRAPDPSIERFGALMQTASSLLTQADRILSAYARNENVPFNFRVLAAQLGAQGQAIGVISANYTLLSDDMRSILDSFIQSARHVFNTISEGYFLASTARIQREALQAFKHEVGQGGGAEQEVRLLDRQQAEYSERAAESLREIAKSAEVFRTACLDMSRLSAGLEVTRVMGKVECARHATIKERTTELLSELEAFQRTVAGALREIDMMNHSIRREAQALMDAA
ncbi:MAG: PAS domain-containing protein [Hyphomonadaceae bacterium]|nr:PAS domain-containing protein [Hyphomonadaceae bacterium]